MTANGEPNSERRSTAGDLYKIVGAIHAMETRVAVLETRMNSQDGRLSVIENDIRDTKATVAQVLKVLNEHVVQENRDRIKLMIGIITLMLSVFGYIGSQAIEALVK